jgi:hypothetical protein
MHLYGRFVMPTQGCRRPGALVSPNVGRVARIPHVTDVLRELSRAAEIATYSEGNVSLVAGDWVRDQGPIR